MPANAILNLQFSAGIVSQCDGNGFYMRANSILSVDSHLQYKLVVNGIWVTNRTSPTTCTDGNMNNILYTSNLSNAIAIDLRGMIFYWDNHLLMLRPCRTSPAFLCILSILHRAVRGFERRISAARCAITDAEASLGILGGLPPINSVSAGTHDAAVGALPPLNSVDCKFVHPCLHRVPDVSVVVLGLGAWLRTTC